MGDLTLKDRSVAVIGSGVSGLTAAYLLAKRDHVTLFEADGRLGGHAHTHELVLDDGRRVRVDTGFIVHNDRTYPILTRLFDELGVATQTTDMSLSVRSDRDGLEYAGCTGPLGLFAQPRLMVDRRYLGLIFDILRFHRAARSTLRSTTDETLEEFLRRNRFGAYFAEHFMRPLISAVWSCDPEVAPQYPAQYLFRFLDHHGMLTVLGSPTWRTVTNGSSRYVEKIAAGIDEVLMSTRVVRVDRNQDGVRITDIHGDERQFDAVVIAAHPDQALRMLAQPSPLEKNLLASIPYSTNHVQLHSDESLLPRARRARAAWNYLIPKDRTGSVIVTYDLTRLMRIEGVRDRRFLVTLGGAHLVEPNAVIAEMIYHHPIYTPKSVAAQARLHELNGPVVSFAGAYHGWGFHEDGALSGLKAAQRVGAAGLVLAP
ncbi:NAD(P)/FAD-dependent oxidoreductase [Nocardia suismassiliense]|uniref:NAD(P)/FAD-dependent oxidoreductase n=1 Tax=Nocardia suismassiliense TaxID=2077092 RepID=UPI000D1ED9CD|nr:FAD-dependent oxidoreductase [Nocardia suismassiliense]